ncbi:MAG: ribose 5-phosphate isomerase B [Oligoflexia bacterium]|nr:ribose 5-phosphate isomerase B [Oligoflexia bacterium]
MTKVLIASDHAGLVLKEFLKSQAALLNIEFVDLGTHADTSVDYPDFATLLCKELLGGKASLGVLVCGSGQGMAMRANRFKGIRAALAWDETVARLSREHNNSNVLCLGSRLIPNGLAVNILKSWLNTSFAGGRHQGRVEKLDC